MKAIKFYGIGFNDPQDFIVSWNLGNSCNWKCDYCPSYLNDGSVYWIDNDTIKKVLLQIKNHFSDRQIRLEFTGGEVVTKTNNKTGRLAGVGSMLFSSNNWESVMLDIFLNEGHAFGQI